MIIEIFLVLLFAGAMTYRMRGMGSSSFPPILESRLVRRLLPLLVLSAAFFVVEPSLGYWCFVVVPLGFYGIIMGHGSYMDLTRSKGHDNEVFASLLDWFFGEESETGPVYPRDFVGLALTGLALSVPVAVGLYFIDPVFIWYAFTGILKPVGYVIGWKLFDMKIQDRWEFPVATEFGEWFWGFGMVLGVLLTQFPSIYPL